MAESSPEKVFYVDKTDTAAVQTGRMPSQPVETWYTDAVQPLNRENFLSLLRGNIPAIRISAFASLETSHRLAKEVTSMLTPYLHATGPAVEKVGVAQFEFQAQSAEDYNKRTGNEKDQYFSEVAKLKNLHDDLAKAVGENVWAKAVATLAALVPEWDVGVATEGQNREYFSGIFRCINNGVPIHCDWCPYDCITEDWIINKITHQAVFNLYITHVEGGRTTMYDVQWSPDALKYRDPETYGYFPKLVEHQKSCTFEPEIGDLFIFNSRNMHTVRAVDDVKGPGRVAMASFMGLLPPSETGGRPKLIFWS
ncbi:unnamed protein product [Zymoseptoria tritici ST99CH_3D1]|uniref:Prolyl 4-hydroxylase alpha subunit Fe(2+) 2OG dioxygenase domain-containing protein n=2 Tax=Zymoseptoria tritici TaxID=1047171 RepID=A0A1X7RIY1_ZYMT9|nr:unnamed protein product [Zymoseptoria tritici ST99CH_3D7]SMR47158.1 unnamed protein product [Zymoseptoria tritici ST99CH_3D1]